MGLWLITIARLTRQNGTIGNKRHQPSTCERTPQRSLIALQLRRRFQLGPQRIPTSGYAQRTVQCPRQGGTQQLGSLTPADTPPPRRQLHLKTNLQRVV